MIKATVVFIDKSRPDFPIHIEQFPVDEGVLWDYYHKDDDSLLSAAKFLMGIPENVPTFRAVFVDHLVDPATGEVHTGVDYSIDDFLSDVLNRQRELVFEAQQRSRVCRVIRVPVVRV